MSLVMATDIRLPIGSLFSAIGAVFPIDVWIPAPAYAKPTVRDRSLASNKVGEAEGVWLNIFGRLRPGVSLAQAQELGLRYEGDPAHLARLVPTPG